MGEGAESPDPRASGPVPGGDLAPSDIHDGFSFAFGACGTLRLRGEADLLTEHLVDEAITQLRRQPHPHRIDLAELTFIDARCLGLLLACATSTEQPIVLLAPPPQVRRILDILDVTSSGSVRIEDR